MSATIEIHGLSRCPFAFRTRIAAREKDVSFDWFPFDAPQPHPHVASNNPGKRSPLMVHGDFTLVESSIICQYIDEAFAGAPLQPTAARGRAQMRLTMIELGRLKVDGRQPLTEDAMKTAEGALRALDDKLASAEPWLGGNTPSLADVEIWPWLAILDAKGVLSSDRLASTPRAASYWERVQQRDSFRLENPYRR